MDEFSEWMRAFANSVMEKSGLDYRDFADWDFRSAHESEATPSEAADEFLEEQGFPTDD
jgi:hypothetical protein